MARVLKWILIAVAALVVLLIAAVVAVVVLVDPNAYKGQIAQAVEQRTGRTLTIEGDLDLTFFPWLGLKLGQAQLSDAPGFGDQPFARLDGARLAVAVWPLLSERRLVLDKIEVNGLNLRLIRNEQGRGNWEDLAERFAAEEQAPPEPQPEQPDRQLAIESKGGLELNDAVILWEDRQTGARYLVNPLSVTVSELNIEQPIPLRARWMLQATDAPEIGGELVARVLYDQAGQKIAVQDLSLDALARGEQLPGGELKANLRGVVEADLQGQRYTVPRATLQAAGVVANLVAEASMQNEQLAANGTLTLPSFNARELMRRLELEVPPTADPNALANVALTAQLRYDGQGLTLEQLKGELDQTNISGQAQVPSFEPLTARFELALDQLDLDRYLAPAQEDEPAPTPPSEPAPAPPSEPTPESELPVELLRELNLDGTVRIGRLTVKRVDVTDVTTTITARNGVIKAEPVAALYQGRLRGELTLDATQQQPQLAMQQRLEGVQAGSLLEDLVGVARVLGVADLDLAVAMQGLGVDDWLRTASGQASFKFADGAINGINIAQAIQTARAKLAGEPLPATAEAEQTPFNELTGSVRIDEGLLLNRDFNLASSLFKIAGDGTLNLRTQEVDYTLNVNLLEPLLEGSNKLLAELRNVPIPVEVSGNVRDLGVRVDLQQALEQAGKARLQEAEDKARARVQEEVQERRQEAEQRLQEKVQKGLQNLLRPR